MTVKAEDHNGPAMVRALECEYEGLLVCSCLSPQHLYLQILEVSQNLFTQGQVFQPLLPHLQRHFKL